MPNKDLESLDTATLDQMIMEGVAERDKLTDSLRSLNRARDVAVARENAQNLIGRMSEAEMAELKAALNGA